MYRLYWTAETPSRSFSCSGDITGGCTDRDGHYCGLLLHSLCTKSAQEDLAELNKDDDKAMRKIKGRRDY
jgi:hypothetical protein